MPAIGDASIDKPFRSLAPEGLYLYSGRAVYQFMLSLIFVHAPRSNMDHVQGHYM